MGGAAQEWAATGSSLGEFGKSGGALRAQEVRLVPGHFVQPVAPGAPHGGGPAFQRRAPPAGGTDAIALSPARGNPARVARSRHHAPAAGRSRDDLQQRPGDADRLAVHVQHRFHGPQLEDPVPRPAAQLDVDVGLQSGPLLLRHRRLARVRPKAWRPMPSRQAATKQAAVRSGRRPVPWRSASDRVPTAAGGQLMLNALLTSANRPAVVAVNRYAVFPEPARLMLRSENVATPPMSVSVFVPDSTAPGAPVPAVIEMVTVPANVFTTLLYWSRTSTSKAAIGVPAVVVAGCEAKCVVVAAPARIANEALLTPAVPADEAESL